MELDIIPDFCSPKVAILHSIIPELQYNILDYFSIIDLIHLSENSNNLLLLKLIEEKINLFKYINSDNIEEFFNLHEITKNCDSISFYSYRLSDTSNNKNLIKDLLKNDNYLYKIYQKINYSKINNNNNIIFTEINSQKNPSDICMICFGISDNDILNKKFELNMYYLIENNKCYVIHFK